MKQHLLALLVGVTALLFSCQKEDLVTANPGETAAIKITSPGSSEGSTAGRQNCEPFPFGILALNSGTFTSSNLDVEGNMGYSKFATSTSNANLRLNGECFAHSSVGNLLFSASSYLPVLGIQTNSMVDWKLDEANDNATNLSANYAALAPDFTYTSITYNKTITSTCTATGNPNTVINISSLNMSGETLTLVGAPSSDDGFIINVTGSFTFSGSTIKLTNIRPERVLFNFPNTSTIQVKSDAKFKGTILAPKGYVLYLSPESYEGSIVAKTIYAYAPYSNYSSGGSGCGGSSGSTTPVANFIQKTYCNGYQWQ